MLGSSQHFDIERLQGCLISAWRDAIKQGYASGESYSLGNEGEKAVKDFVEEICKEPAINSVASMEYIRKLVMDAIPNLLETKEAEITSQVRRLIDEILAVLQKEPREWQLIIPIVNVRMADLSELLVGRVRITKYENSLFGPLTLESRRHILNFMFPGKKVEELDFDKTMSNWTFAVVAAKALDPTKVKEIAMPYINSALHILRLYNAGLFNKRFRERQAYLDIKGLLDYSVIPTFFTTRDGLQIVGWENRAFVMEMQISAEGVELMRKDEFDTLSQIVVESQNVKSSDLIKSRIFTSIGLFGTAVNIRTDSETFITLMSSLEALLLEQGDTKVVLALRCSVLVTDNPELRRSVHDDLVELYTKRNNLIHRGLRDVNLVDVYKLKQVCYRAIIATARKSREYARFSEFKEWMLKELLGKPNP